MKLVVFGASGKTGSHLVRLAAARGHAVSAVVRPATPFDPPAGVEVVRGEVLDADFVARAVPSHDAAASALGIRYAHPFATRTSPDDLISRATSNIVEAMRRGGVGRLSIISAAGVGDSRPILPWLLRFLVATSNVGVAYADLERTEAIVRQSGLDWQAVRPVTLSNRPPRGGARRTNRFPMTASISREAVAAFMLDELERPEFTSRTPIIAE